MKLKSVDIAYKTLEVGRVYSYKELCEILKEKPKTGNSKPSQIARWNNYFELEKVSRSEYRVMSMKDNPPEQVNPYRGKVLECEEEFNAVLYYCLFNRESYYRDNTEKKQVINKPDRIITENENGEMDMNLHLVGNFHPEMRHIYIDLVRDAYYFDKNELIKTMGLYDRRINFAKTYKDIPIDNFAIRLFKETVAGKSREVFDYRMKKLVKQEILEYKDCIVWSRTYWDDKRNEDRIKNYVLPDRFTVIWKECEQEALKVLNYRNVQDVIADNGWERYVKTTKEIAMKINKEFEHCEKKKIVIFNAKYVNGIRTKYVDNYWYDNPETISYDRYMVLKCAFEKVKKKNKKNVAKLKEMMNRLCKERIIRKIARINKEHEEGQKAKKEECYTETRKLLDEMKEMGCEYPEIEKQLKEVDAKCEKRIEINVAQELLKLCDRWVGGIGTEEETENSELSEEK